MNFNNLLYFLKDTNIEIIIWNRNILIKDYMLRLRLLVHNGNMIIPIFINKNILNYNLNEFIFTKSIDILKKKKIYKRKQKKKK